MPQTTPFVLTNAALATMEPGAAPYGLIADGAIAIAGGRIEWAGTATDLPAPFRGWEQRDQSGRVITPGLIDCHTHLIHGGNRAGEFEMRLGGATYEDIAQAGGGINASVSATRAASVAELVESALPRLDALLGEGVSCVEIKSGYGLDMQTELNMLRAARMLQTRRRVRIVTTFLGAHATPPAYKGRNAAYIDEVCLPTLKAAHREGLVDAVDGFCEGIAFQPGEIETLFRAAHRLGLPVKLHAEQLSNLGGARLAARYGALSADHLEYAGDDEARALAASGSVAVLLPGAYYTLRQGQAPPVGAFRKHQVPMAVASDGNPGSSPMFSLLLAMNMACTLFEMTPQEALAGTTRNAARALGLDESGMIRAGFAADLAIWNIGHPRELAYRIGFNPLHARLFAGRS